MFSTSAEIFSASNDQPPYSLNFLLFKEPHNSSNFLLVVFTNKKGKNACIIDANPSKSNLRPQHKANFPCLKYDSLTEFGCSVNQFLIYFMI